jgi:hypothetical protein
MALLGGASKDKGRRPSHAARDMFTLPMPNPTFDAQRKFDERHTGGRSAASDCSAARRWNEPHQITYASGSDIIFDLCSCVRKGNLFTAISINLSSLSAASPR